MKFNYKGREIELRATGKFATTIGSTFRLFPSLNAAHKAIDKNEGETFEPFPVLVDVREVEQRSHYRDAPKMKPRRAGKFLVHAQVLEIKRAVGKKSWRNRDEYRLSTGGCEHSVLLDTPKNLAIYSEMREKEERLEAFRLQTEKEVNELKEKLEYKELP